jgi:type II secretory pathway pseudopilin PulG
MGVSPGEFLVVAALVGILCALAVRESMAAIPRVKQVEASGLVTRAKVHWAEVWANEGLRAHSAPLVDHHDGTYFYPGDGDSEGTANFILNGKFGDDEGGIISFRPAFSEGDSPYAIVWVCGNAPAPRGFELRGENLTTVPNSKLTAACRVHK